MASEREPDMVVEKAGDALGVQDDTWATRDDVALEKRTGVALVSENDAALVKEPDDPLEKEHDGAFESEPGMAMERAHDASGCLLDDISEKLHVEAWVKPVYGASEDHHNTLERPADAA